MTLVAALLSGMLYTAGVRTAHAAEVTVNDWDSLYDAFINSASGTTILLGANITQPSGALTVPSATDLTLDLAGNTLSITSLSNSAIYVNAGTALTIEDSSVDGSGRLVAMSNRQSYAGIGGGPNSAAGTITINGGIVSATGGEHAAGIGSGFNAAGGTININGGVVNVTGGLGSAGIGGGYGSTGVTINITGGTVTANGGSGGAGIGGREATINITGGTVTANGGSDGAGIGGGYYSAGGTININGGVVSATGGANGAGIGGGAYESGGTIQITGGMVTATSGDYGAGIGGGRFGGGGTIDIQGGTVIPSTGESHNVSVIGAGDGAPDPSFDLANGGTITIPEGYQLIIPEGVTVENSGTINGNGTITGGGNINNTGTITVDVAGPAVDGVAFEFRYNLNGGSGSIPSIIVYAATLQEVDVVLPQPVREGFEFEGWYTQPTGGDEVTATYAISGDMDLFAHWKEVNPPTVTLSSSAGDPVNGAFEVTATFSEEVTGFTVEDIEVTNGTAGNFSEVNGATYTFDVTSTADGPVTVEIPAGIAQDTVGRGNTVSAPLTRMYDGTAATVTLSSSAGDPLNGPFEVTAVFSEGVTGFGVDDIEVTNGTAGDFSVENGWTYMFVVTPTADGEVTIEIPAGVAADTAGNGSTASLPLTRTYDGTAPTVTLSSSAGDPLNGPFEVTAAFSEGVTGFGVGDIEVTNGTAGDFSAENGWTYTFIVTPTADGEVTIEIPAGVAADTVGNGSTASLPLTRTYDGTAPTVTLSSSAGDPLNGSFEVTAAFSKEITGFEVGDIEVTNGTAGDFHAENSWTYTFVITPTADGELTVEIPAGVASDTAGNGNTASLPLTRMYDGTAPTVTLSSSAGDPLNGSFEVTAAFSKEITGFEVGDIEVTNGTAGDFHAENSWTYTFVITPTADGELTVEIPAGVASDTAGNGNTASLPLTRMYDGTAPMVTLSSSTGDPLNGPFEVTAAFSEGVTGFEVGDIEVTNGTAGDFHAENGWTYTFVITPTADGTVTVEIPAGVASDTAGNGNIVSAPLTRTYDGTAPTVTLSSSAGDPLNGPFEVTAAFSKEVTGFEVGDIEVTNGTAGDFNAENSWTYTFVITPTADGPVTVEIPAGGATDAAGNGNIASAPLTRTYDGTAPVVMFSPDSNADPAQRAETTVTVDHADDLSLLAYVWTPSESAPETDAPEWQPFTSGNKVAQTSGNGDWYVHIHAVDRAGNEVVASSGPFLLDNVPPVIVLKGENPFYVPVGQPYAEPGAEATDNIDGIIDDNAITVNNEVDTTRLGVYEVRYETSDRAGNAAMLTRSVYVYDGDAPVIHLNGDNPMVVSEGSTFTDPGATAYDAQDGDLTDAITVTGAVYTDRSGTYDLVYHVSDSSGNAAPTVTRTVYVIMPPVITLLGSSSMTITAGEPFIDPGATAADGYYGDLTDRIVVTGTVLANQPGSYALRYNVQNPIGQTAAEMVRTVTVESADDPVEPGGPNKPNKPNKPDQSGGLTGPNTPNDPDEPASLFTANIWLGNLLAKVRMTTETSPDGQPITRLFLTPEQVAQVFSDARTEAVISVEGLGPAVKISMPAAPLLGVLNARPDVRLRVIVNGSGLLVPLSVIGALSEEATVTVTIAEAAEAASDIMEKTIRSKGAVSLLTHPVSFGLDTDGKAVDEWNAIYRERTISLSAAIDPERTTAVWIDARGELHFAPSTFASDSDGSLTATIRSPQDGFYTIVVSNKLFADVGAHWAETEIGLLANKRIVEGQANGGFTPDAPITRAEFAALLVRALGLPDSSKTRRSFTDVRTSDWYAGAVGAAEQAGVIRGFEDGSFRPDGDITREQMAAMIARALAFAGAALPAADATVLESFADSRDIADWAAQATANLAESGIVQGMSDTAFVPRAAASRAQSVVILKRMLQYLHFID
ncbi:Ig-like domain-containing protein [Cohnella cellulosilytica]